MATYPVTADPSSCQPVAQRDYRNNAPVCNQCLLFTGFWYGEGFNGKAVYYELVHHDNGVLHHDRSQRCALCHGMTGWNCDLVY